MFHFYRSDEIDTSKAIEILINVAIHRSIFSQRRFHLEAKASSFGISLYKLKQPAAETIFYTMVHHI